MGIGECKPFVSLVVETAPGCGMMVSIQLLGGNNGAFTTT